MQFTAGVGHFWVPYAKNVGIYLGRQILLVGIILGIKYEPLSAFLPLPVIKISEWGPWDQYIIINNKRNKMKF